MLKYASPLWVSNVYILTTLGNFVQVFGQECIEEGNDVFETLNI